jgi:hypothetical protein
MICIFVALSYLLIVKVFQVDYGPVVFPASGFPRKNLGVDLCD